jgi:hypothetical protein
MARFQELVEAFFADILARIAYLIGGAVVFIGGAVIVFAELSRRPNGPSYEDLPIFAALGDPGFWLLAAGVGFMTMIIGPGIYQRRIMRGRGTLHEVRAVSRQRPPKD